MLRLDPPDSYCDFVDSTGHGLSGLKDVRRSQSWVPDFFPPPLSVSRLCPAAQ